MSRILQDFLQTCMGKTIFCSIGTVGTGKAGCEGILEDYDERYIFLKGKGGIMVISKKYVLTYECMYSSINTVEIV